MSHTLSYTLRQRCRARNDFRIPQIVEFLKLMKQAFHISDVYDVDDKPVELTIPNLSKISENETRESFLGVGANFDFFSIPPEREDDDTVRFEVSTGTCLTSRLIDTYNISMGDARKVPDLTYFEISIGFFTPLRRSLRNPRMKSS